MRKLILAATLAALAVPAIAPVLASAAPSANQTFSVGTHSPQHLDTTSRSLLEYPAPLHQIPSAFAKIE